jgi:hydroxymethylbilane synthase
MNARKFIIGTRGSALALAQARHFAAELQKSNPDVVLEEKIIKTRGDLRMDVRLAGTGPLDKGLFTRELEAALLEEKIDCAVHSLKDLPVEMPEGFALGAILPREDPADVLICKSGHSPGIVATSSPRRALQLGLQFPGVQIREIRGNVPTRIRKLMEDPSLDAIVLALAGLKRLGFCNGSACWLQDQFTGLDLSVIDSMLPAPGQGAVGIQIRAGCTRFDSLLQSVHCAETALCVSTERALLTALGGGCHLALGARAWIESDNKKPLLHLRGVYFPDETPGSALHGEVSGDTGDVHALAENLKNQWIKQ